MKYLLPFLAIFVFTACTKKNVAELPYDIPPSAPIPPQQSCYVQTGADITNPATLQLTIAGDSVFGALNYAKPGNRPADMFTGVIYGATLEVTYRYKDQKGWQTQAQEWKLTGDSIYRVPGNTKINIAADSGASENPASVLSALYKVPCK